MDYVLEVLAKAVASTDPCRTAFSVLVPLLLSIVLGTLFVPRVLLLSRKRKLYDIPDCGCCWNSIAIRRMSMRISPVSSCCRWV